MMSKAHFNKSVMDVMSLFSSARDQKSFLNLALVHLTIIIVTPNLNFVFRAACLSKSTIERNTFNGAAFLALNYIFRTLSIHYRNNNICHTWG